MPDRNLPPPLSGPVRLFRGFMAEPPPGSSGWLKLLWTRPGKGTAPVVVLPADGPAFEAAFRATTRELGPGIPPHQVKDVLLALVAAAGRKGGRDG